MTLNIDMPELRELKPRITVFGVGGAGGNAVNNMAAEGLEGVEFVVANTDAQALAQSKVKTQIQLGTMITEGLGAGSRPEIGAAAAEDSLPDIADHMHGSHMCFITAGMGGGTGTGAAPVIARAARELDILTVGVVTKPFQFEGARRMDIAERGIAELEQHVDTLIVIPNQNLFRIANEHTTFSDAFALADQVLMSGVSGITDLMVKEGLINLDFADVRAIMKDMGKAMMGTGEASGEKRAIEAAEAAISNPLLDDVSMKGAKGLLISITGGGDLTLYEVDEAASRIRGEVDPEANIILGATFDDSLDGAMRVSVVATGIDAGSGAKVLDNNHQQQTTTTTVKQSLGNVGLSHTVPNAQNKVEISQIAPEIETPKEVKKPANEHVGVRRMSANDAVNRAGVRVNKAEEPVQEEAPRSEFTPQRPANQFDNRGVAKPAYNRPLNSQEQGRVAANLGNKTARASLAEQSPAHALRTEDFPPIAQAEIRQHEAQKRAQAEVPAEPHHDDAPRRNGFFDRLANVGLGRKDNNLVDGANQASEPQAAQEEYAEPQQQAPQYEKRRVNEAPAYQAAEPQEERNLEIPAFLRRQNN